MIEPVVLIVAFGQGEGARVPRRGRGTPPGSYSIVVIAAVDPRTKAVACPVVDGSLGNNSLHVGGDVDDVRIALSRQPELRGVNGHAIAR